MELLWAALLIIFIIAEVVSVQLVSVWFAFGSLAALLCAHFTDISVMGQIAVFIIVSAVLLAATFPFIRKHMNLKYVATNSDLDIGQNATVIEEINFEKGSGRVTLSGVDWIAVPENSQDIIPVGSVVTVKNIDGAKLIVSCKSKITN